MAPLSDSRESVDRRLIRRYREHGDVRARDRVVTRWQPALRSFVRPYRDRGQPAEDLMQVANLGLIKALDGFDLARRGRLMSFVAPTVQGEIKRYFRDHTRLLHVNRAAQELHAHVIATATERPRDDPRAVRDLATRAGLDAEQIDIVLRVDQAFQARSLEAPSGQTPEGDSDTTLADAVGTVDREFERAEERMVLDATCKILALKESDREILRLRVEDDLLQREIAERIGCSQMQVSRRLAAIAGDLRDQIKSLTQVSRGHRPA